MEQGCPGCENLDVNPRRLTSGEVVCNTCPEWRLECEASSMLKWPLDARRRHLEQIDQKRPGYGVILRGRIAEIHAARKIRT